MKDSTIQVAVIATLLTFLAGLLTTLVNYFRERSEKERWQRTLDLEREKWERNLEFEERKANYEENRWALDLNNQREMELHKMRLRTYPEVFALLCHLSEHNVDKLDKNKKLEMADSLNRYGYGEAGLCMLPDTRDAVFALRRFLVNQANNGDNIEEVKGWKKPRTDLIELMRRDLNHDWSQWRDFKPLIELNRERVKKSLDAAQGDES